MDQRVADENSLVSDEGGLGSVLVVLELAVKLVTVVVPRMSLFSTWMATANVCK